MIHCAAKFLNLETIQTLYDLNLPIDEHMTIHGRLYQNINTPLGTVLFDLLYIDGKKTAQDKLALFKSGKLIVQFLLSKGADPNKLCFESVNHNLNLQEVLKNKGVRIVNAFESKLNNEYELGSSKTDDIAIKEILAMVMEASANKDRNILRP